ncbi:MAG: zinc-binding dehydrogenase [Firmicutes bacterium]|nr:zinc-binding dehydrogenase [Bacillota bacterium]
MRTAVLEGPGKFVIREVPIPQPQDGEVLIKVASCGVCHSEMGLWDGSFGQYPSRIGHEVSGTIVQLGSGVDSLSEGQRVTIFTDRHGYSEYVAVPAEYVIPIGSNTSFTAALGEPIGCVVNGLRRARIGLGDTVVLVGVGFMGLIMLQLVRIQGAGKVIVVDTRESALSRAAELGAHLCLNPKQDDVKQVVMDVTGGAGADFVIELTGNQSGLDLSSELVRIRGSLVVFGFHTSERRVNMFLWNWRGLDVINAHERDPRIYVEGIRVGMKLLEAGSLDMEPLVTHKFSLEQINEAFAVAYARGEDYVKAVIEP